MVNQELFGLLLNSIYVYTNDLMYNTIKQKEAAGSSLYFICDFTLFYLHRSIRNQSVLMNNLLHHSKLEILPPKRLYHLLYLN